MSDPMLKEMEEWETVKGLRFLRRVGIREGLTVVDFGARVGHYSIPVALLVGPGGKVFALDMDEEALSVLKGRAAALELANIDIIATSGEVDWNLGRKPVDFVLLYDVLHYMNGEKRKELYGEIRPRLHHDSILSVYPKHIATDCPMDHFKDLLLDDVVVEIEKAGFSFERKVCGRLSHDEDLNRGCVLNFRTI